jgi:alkylated DNA repair protein alkB family protein 1
MSDAAVDDDPEVVDFTRGLTESQKKRIIPIDIIPSDLIREAQKSFGEQGEGELLRNSEAFTTPEPCTIYEHQDFPGKGFYKSHQIEC